MLIRTLQEVFLQVVAILQSFTPHLAIFSYEIFSDPQFKWQKFAESIQALETETQHLIDMRMREKYLLLTDAIESLKRNFSDAILSKNSEIRWIICEKL